MPSNPNKCLHFHHNLLRCDYWVADGFDCTALETAYGCECSGCDCASNSDGGLGPADDCIDQDNGATDLYGDACSAYYGSPAWCGGDDDSDFSSDEMCCACGGGDGTATPTATPAPTVCMSTCFGYMCDYWENGCLSLEHMYGCDCTGCPCDDDEELGDDDMWDGSVYGDATYHMLSGSCDDSASVSLPHSSPSDSHLESAHACWDWCLATYDDDLVAVQGFAQQSTSCTCVFSCDDLMCNAENILLLSDNALPENCDGICVEQDFGVRDSDNNGCDHYEGSPELCGTADDADFTAEDLCCECGGGVGGTCTEEDNGATDPYDDGCDAYLASPSWCGGYDDSDFTSEDMCCACGGGGFGGGGGGGGGGGNPDDDDDYVPCENTNQGATGSNGATCNPYAAHPNWCGDYDTEMFDADEMCCSCGGGSFLTPAPTVKSHADHTMRPTVSPDIDVDLVVGLSGIDCSLYGTDEEEVMNLALADVIDGADADDFSSHTCTDETRRRSILGANDIISIETTVSVAASPADSSDDVASIVSGAVSDSVDSGSLTSAIEEHAAVQGVDTLEDTVVTSADVTSGKSTESSDDSNELTITADDDDSTTQTKLIIVVVLACFIVFFGFCFCVLLCVFLYCKKNNAEVKLARRRSSFFQQQRAQPPQPASIMAAQPASMMVAEPGLPPRIATASAELMPMAQPYGGGALMPQVAQQQPFAMAPPRVDMMPPIIASAQPLGGQPRFMPQGNLGLMPLGGQPGLMPQGQLGFMPAGGQPSLMPQGQPLQGGPGLMPQGQPAMPAGSLMPQAGLPPISPQNGSLMPPQYGAQRYDSNRR